MYAGKMIKNRVGKLVPACPKCGKAMVLGNMTKGGAQRWNCRSRAGAGSYCYSTTQPSEPARTAAQVPQERPKVFQRFLGNTKRLIITAAQNATPVHEEFFKSLETYARENDAALLIIPLRYKNPTSMWGESAQNEMWWISKPRYDKDGDLIPDPRKRYLWNTRRQINDNLILLADIKTEAAASEPLRGFESISGTESGIFGHTKLQLRTIPVPKTKLPKILTTTGAVTVKNYTDTKRGKLGEFHHSFSAVVVEFEDKVFHLRHVHADKETGEFTDLNKRYGPTGSRPAPAPEAIILGDTHVDFVDPTVEVGTFGQGGLVETLQPKRLVFHDLLDAYSVNPHHVGNPFNAIAKLRANRLSAGAEVARAIQYVSARTSGTRHGFVVSSNHDDMLRRWIVKADWKEDPTNAEFYLETALAMVKATRLGLGGTETPSPFGMLLRAAGPNVTALAADESLVVAGVELGMHGDVGPSGAPGSIRGLRRIGTRSIIGHSHTPGIEEGCYQVGTSSYLRLEYNRGPSSWLNTHCILHADGKRQLINIIDGTWRM